MIAILDYGSGNLRSAQRACEETGQQVIVTSDYEIALRADGLVVPGVGAFGACMAGLREVKGDALIHQRIKEKKKVLGICVGMQILFQSSAEAFSGNEPLGIGVFPGRVTKLSAPITPQIGWNTVSAPADSTLFKGIDKERFYFVHSYFAECAEIQDVAANTHYGFNFASAFSRNNIYGVQFHPEKSHRFGLELFRRFISL